MKYAYWLVVFTGIIVASTALQAEPPAPKFPRSWLDKNWSEPAHSSTPRVYDLQLSRDGRKLLVGWASAVRVFDLKAGKSILLDSGSDKAICYPMFAPDAQTVAGIRGADPDWELVFWDAATGKELGRKAMKRATANYWRPMLLGFDGGGAAWVVRPAGAVDLVAVPTGKVVRSIELPFTAGAWGRLMMSPDGNWLALGGGTRFAIRRTTADADWIVIKRHTAPSRLMICRSQPPARSLADSPTMASAW